MAQGVFIQRPCARPGLLRRILDQEGLPGHGDGRWGRGGRGPRLLVTAQSIGPLSEYVCGHVRDETSGERGLNRLLIVRGESYAALPG